MMVLSLVVGTLLAVTNVGVGTADDDDGEDPDDTLILRGSTT